LCYNKLKKSEAEAGRTEKKNSLQGI